MNILYHLASSFMRNLKNAYDSRTSNVFFKKENKNSEIVKFESTNDDKVCIIRYAHPNVYFKVNINQHNPKIYPLDKYLLKKMFKKLKNEATDVDIN